MKFIILASGSNGNSTLVISDKEELLLITDEYKQEVCYSILLGVLEYLR